MQHSGLPGKIAVGVDASPGSRAAASWALQEALTWGAGVVAVYAWHLSSLAYSSPGYAPPGPDEFDADGRALVAKVFAELPAAGEVKVEARISEGPPVAVLAGVAKQPGIDLVVVGSRGHGGVAGLLLGSVSHALTHQCSKPLVIVPKASSAPDSGRIVVGIDGSCDSARALKWAAREARQRGATLQVVLACFDAKFARHNDKSFRGSPSPAGQEIVDSAVAALGASGVAIERTVVEGRPAPVLLEMAGAADLLVVGTRGLGRAKETIHGSVSHACAHRSPVPVAIIPNSE
jgi:nucleotide-binding universal stress UspA family protein